MTRLFLFVSHLLRAYVGVESADDRYLDPLPMFNSLSSEDEMVDLFEWSSELSMLENKKARTDINFSSFHVRAWFFFSQSRSLIIFSVRCHYCDQSYTTNQSAPQHPFFTHTHSPISMHTFFSSPALSLVC